LIPHWNDWILLLLFIIIILEYIPSNGTELNRTGQVGKVASWLDFSLINFKFYYYFILFYLYLPPREMKTRGGRKLAWVSWLVGERGRGDDKILNLFICGNDIGFMI
jgi:hypothetical protein